MNIIKIRLKNIINTKELKKLNLIDLKIKKTVDVNKPKQSKKENIILQMIRQLCNVSTAIVRIILNVWVNQILSPIIQNNQYCLLQK